MNVVHSWFGSLRLLFDGPGDGENLGAQIVRGGVGSLCVKGLHMVLMLALMVLLARLMGADGYGVYSYVFALVQILAIPAQLGLQTLVVREIAAYQEREQWPRLIGVLRFGFLTILGLAAGIVLVVGVATWSQGWRWSDVQLNTLLWGLVLLPFMALGNFRGAALRGLKKIFQGLLPENVLLPGGLLLFCTGFWILSPTADLPPDRAMSFHAAAAAAAFLVGTWLLSRQIPAKAKRAAPDYEVRRWLSAAVPLALVGGIQMINSRADLIMLGIFGTARDVGVYRVAADGGVLVVFALRAINMAVAPHFSALWSAGDIERLQRLVTATARAALLFSLPVAAGLIVFGSPILTLVFGQEFSASYVPLAIIVVGQVFNAAVGSVVVLLNMTGRESTVMRGLIIAAVLNVAMNLVLIPLWNTAGAAVATVVTFAVWNLILWSAARRDLGINSMAVSGFAR